MMYDTEKSNLTEISDCPEACEGAPECFDEIGCSHYNNDTQAWIYPLSACNKFNNSCFCGDDEQSCKSCAPRCNATVMIGCHRCGEFEACFDEDGCSYQNETTQKWDFPYQYCDDSFQCKLCYQPCETKKDTTKENFCSGCSQCTGYGKCFDVNGCSHYDGETMTWSEPYHLCQHVRSCAPCFPSCSHTLAGTKLTLLGIDELCSGCHRCFGFSNCFSDKGCQNHDMNTSLWSNEFEACNGIEQAPDCKACFPNC